MRFSLQQLRKFSKPYSFKDDVSLDELIGFEGILKILNLDIEGLLNEVDYNTFTIDFHLKCDLVLECAVSLEEVLYPLDINFKEVFSLEEDDETFKIEQNTLDTKEALITNILVNKPVKVYKEGVSFTDEDEHFQDEEEDEGINPAFKSLKDLL